jgi:hypothetical protein
MGLGCALGGGICGKVLAQLPQVPHHYAHIQELLSKYRVTQAITNILGCDLLV